MRGDAFHDFLIGYGGNMTFFIRSPTLAGFLSPNPIHIRVRLVEVSEDGIHYLKFFNV